jgi:hypothetical protein
MSTSGVKTASLEARIRDLELEVDELKRREAVVRKNVALFGKVDFKAWNKRDWELFRRLHTDDVRVTLGSMVTKGADAHTKTMRAMLESSNNRVTSHDVMFGNGDWTCCIATTEDSTSNGRESRSTICTVAKWQDGRIAEEHLFVAPSVIE